MADKNNQNVVRVRTSGARNGNPKAMIFTARKLVFRPTNLWFPYGVREITPEHAITHLLRCVSDLLFSASSLTLSFLVVIMSSPMRKCLYVYILWCGMFQRSTFMVHFLSLNVRLGRQKRANPDRTAWRKAKGSASNKYTSRTCYEGHERYDKFSIVFRFGSQDTILNSLFMTERLISSGCGICL